MGQTNDASLREDGHQGARRRLLLALLLLVALATTSMVSYILGRSASGSLGQATDTIQLAPEEASARTTTHLTGQVAYEDGSPAAGVKLELHSDPIASETDDQGIFLFPNVPFGTHRVIVYGPDGSIAAERPVTIAQSQSEQGVSIANERDGGCAITVAVDVRILEIAIRLADDGLDILATGCTYANGDGWITTPTGTVSIKSGVVVTPNGHVHLPDGTIVIPRNGQNATAIILPDDTVIYPDENLDGTGYTVRTDGTVVLSSGVEIRPGGRVVTSDGVERGPGEGGVVVSGENVVTPIGGSSSGNADATSPSPVTDAPVIRDLPSGGGAAGGGNASSGGTVPSGGNEPSGGSDPVVPDDPDEPEEPSDPDAPTDPDDPADPADPADPDEPDNDPGVFSAYGQNRSGEYVQWTQSSSIDLFYNRTTGGQERIAPGSSGYYAFRLQNTRSSQLNVTISFSEADLHLPLAFTLTPVDEGGRSLDGQAVRGSLSANGGLALRTVVAGQAVAGYRLDWEWPFEGNDELDTGAGSGDNLAYLLTMKIRAEQL